MNRRLAYAAVGLTCLLCAATSLAQTIGKPGPGELVIADGGRVAAQVLVSKSAGEWERRAADDLARYLAKLAGASPPEVTLIDGGTLPAAADRPQFIVGQLALAARPTLRERLQQVAKKNPLLRADAIVVQRDGSRVYLAGTNDDSHYYAVAELLRQWGCRWYMPTEFGECIPRHATLKIGTLDLAYGSPFEIRRYWISWVGDTSGRDEFMRRNFFNDESVPNGHALGQYVKDLVPPGKSVFHVPISSDKTAEHVARQVLPTFRAGKHVMLGMEDGLYQSDDPVDRELIALRFDKYFQTQSVTDAFLTFYNKVATILERDVPNVNAKIGFLAYANMTLPPVRPVTARKSLVAYLAPIDIDPIHGMDDPRSGPRREYREILEGWAKVMEGRLVIYDYDQSMLVWRDLPNPSFPAFRQDVKHYQRVGILGVDTESRNAIATTMLNLHLRGQLLWNPNFDVDEQLREFYTKFYGPASGPMSEYWTAIHRAWEETLVTEHEHFVVPAVYPRELVEKLGKQLAAAEQAVASWKSLPAPSAEQKAVLDRLRFTRLGFQILDAYTHMVQAAATDVDYRTAVAAGERGLAAREELTAMNGTFTTYKKIGEHGPAWWPGEVQHYRELAEWTNGPKGTLVARLPLEWAFRRDLKNVGVAEKWATQKADLGVWKQRTEPTELERRQKNAGDWEPVRSDIYLQAQGLITPDYQSFTGQGWYQADVELTAAQTQGKIHLRFPGLFNECWLYVNGQEVAHREFPKIWWLGDYKFEWDVNLSDRLRPGSNSVTLRINNPHHFGGMFRRPFLYRAP